MVLLVKPQFEAGRVEVEPRARRDHRSGDPRPGPRRGRRALRRGGCDRHRVDDVAAHAAATATREFLVHARHRGRAPGGRRREVGRRSSPTTSAPTPPGSPRRRRPGSPRAVVDAWIHRDGRPPARCSASWDGERPIADGRPRRSASAATARCCAPCSWSTAHPVPVLGVNVGAARLPHRGRAAELVDALERLASRPRGRRVAPRRADDARRGRRVGATHRVGGGR